MSEPEQEPTVEPTVEPNSVARYLMLRLEQLGLGHCFTIAGNYSAAFLNAALEEREVRAAEDKRGPFALVGVSNEINAGHAVDGYARVHGIGAVCVTYGVGSFSLLNPVAGSFVEHCPVVIINGSPTNRDWMENRSVGVLYSHMTGDSQADINAFRPVTVAAEQITNAQLAPLQIDSALAACITHSRPVYLEVFEDVWRMPCDHGRLDTPLESVPRAGSATEAGAAADAVMKLLDDPDAYPVFWGGVELARQGLQDRFLQLAERCGYLFTTSILGKSVVGEDHPLYYGVFNGNASPPHVQQLYTATVGTEDTPGRGAWIGLGAWTTSKNLGGADVFDDNIALAAHGGVKVGAKYFADVTLAAFIDALQARLEQRPPASVPATPQTHQARRQRYVDGLNLKRPALRLPEPIRAGGGRRRVRGGGFVKVRRGPGAQLQELLGAHKDRPLTYDGVMEVVQRCLRHHQGARQPAVLADAGFPLLAAQSLDTPVRGSFVAQAAWLSIGYSVPASMGVRLALQDAARDGGQGSATGDRRAFVFVGDGAFHETAQAVSDAVHNTLDTVFFVLDNGIYGIEQLLVNPNPFRKPPDDYPQDTLQVDPYAYNRLPKWDFVQLAQAFGAQGVRVETVGELARVMKQLHQGDPVATLVHVVLPEDDLPESIRYKLDGVGEDEWANADWSNFKQDPAP